MKKIILLFFLFISAFQSIAQCAMCKAVIESSTEDEQLQVGNSINFGILYLMAVPYIILFFVFRKKIGAFWREFKSMQ